MKETTLNSTTIFEGRALTLEKLEIEIEPGVRSSREIVRHGGAIAVLAQLADGEFVLVRQYRKAVESEVLEVVAGCLDPDEEPSDCAARELKEETGYKADSLERLGSIWTSPGYSSEKIHLFFARVGGGQGDASPDPDERLEVVRMSEQDIDAKITGGEIRDGKSLATWLLWKNRRHC